MENGGPHNGVTVNGVITMPAIIAKKRDGQALSETEIEFFVRSVVEREVEDSQLGAMLMAIFLQGMHMAETVHLTRCMKVSGEVLQWPAEWATLMVDKHSTGGVGDKASLPLTPALAACGLKVPMISGRGLEHTGGTLDKLESIPGFNVTQSASRMRDILSEVGCCIVGQTESLVPADRLMYAARDVTGTVNSVPLIAGSIVSKKAAESLHSLVLDVKVGGGAFMKTKEDALSLARTLVSVSNGCGVRTTAVLSSMDSPLGQRVGNALEVMEAIDCLHGRGPRALRTLVTTLGSHLLVNSGRASSESEAVEQLEAVLDDGRALAVFRDMLVAQGVEPGVATKLCSGDDDAYSCLPASPATTDLRAPCSGYVDVIEAMVCAEVSCELGAGRTRASQPVDHSVGLTLHVQRGDYVKQGSVWVTVHHKGDTLSSAHTSRLQAALHLRDADPEANPEEAPVPQDAPPLIVDIVKE